MIGIKRERETGWAGSPYGVRENQEPGLPQNDVGTLEKSAGQYGKILETHSFYQILW